MEKVLFVEMEIKDLTTGCTYIKSGPSEQSCIDQFQELFFGKRPYEVLWKKEVKQNV